MDSLETIEHAQSMGAPDGIPPIELSQLQDTQGPLGIAQSMNCSVGVIGLSLLGQHVFELGWCQRR